LLGVVVQTKGVGIVPGRDVVFGGADQCPDVSNPPLAAQDAERGLEFLKRIAHVYRGREPPSRPPAV
jgi:hypothetical protein